MALVDDDRVNLPKNYRPTDKEPFMNPRMQEYFRRKLLTWRDEIVDESRTTLGNLREENVALPDMADRASSESDRALELRARDRQRKLIAKIDSALRRIETGDYGYCEDSGEPIGVARLDARPIATLSLEAQERHERSERLRRDD
jgi:DnaK suppressor protein